jgi:hypothetical protein
MTNLNIMKNNYLTFLKSWYNTLKIVSILIFLLSSSLSGFGQTTNKFNDGYLTVFKVSSGTALTNTGTAIVLEEYSPLTASQTSSNYNVAVPTTGTSKVVVSGTASSAGAISLSENGRYILLPGYNGSVGDANTTFTTNGTVRTLSGSGVVGAGIASTVLWFSGNNNLRGATSDDGTNYWLSGGSTGIQYTNSPSSVSTISTTSTNTRVINIFNGQLFFSTGSATNGIYQVGSGKPTSTGQTSVVQALSTVPYGFSVSPDGLTIYAFGSANTIVRFTYSGSYNSSTFTYSGGTWSIASTGFSLTSATGIAVDWTGYTFNNGTNGAKIYACNPTTIVAGNDNGTGSITTTTLRTISGSNNAFRGLSFSPVKQTVSKGANTPITGNINTLTNNAVLFQFNLSADEGNSTLKKVIITKSGSATIGSGNNISNFRLIDDANNDGLASASEIAVSLATGTVTGSDIIFNSVSLSSYITEGSNKNLLLIGDISSSGNGNTFTPSISANKSLNSLSYTTNINNAGGSWVNVGNTPPTGNTLTIVASSPTITSTGTLNQVNTTYGTSSTTPTSFTVSGSNLTNDILVTPPTGYEISKTSAGTTGYATTQSLMQSGGTVSSTTIYVRLKSDATVAGSPYSGNIVLSSTGATSVNVATVSSSVSPKALTITGLTADNKVYNGNTTASLSGTPAYSGLENGETFSVSGTATASFATAAVANGKTVSVSGYTAPSTNYTLTQPTLTANITPAILTISGAIASNKVYDGNNSATITGTLLGVIGSETVTLNPSGTFSQTGIGTILTVTSTSTLGGVDAGNYSLTQPSGITADITAKPLTINGLTANNKVFDGNTSATLSGTATLNGVISGEGANVTLTGSPTATFAQSAVGIAIAVTVTGYSLTGSGSGNYTVSQPAGITADITNTPSPVINSTLTATATYGVASTSYFITATNTPTSYNATGIPTGLTINTSTGEITGTPTDIAGSPFSVALSATNLGGTGTATLVYTITPKALTVTTLIVPNKVYDGTNVATITGTLTGVIGTDVVTLSGTGTFSQTTVGTALVVTSTSTLAGADVAKYTLTQLSGLSANITARPLTITGLTANNKVFDNNTTATLSGTAVLNGIIGTDDVNLSGIPIATFASSAVGIGIAVTVTGYTLSGTLLGNYSLSQPTGLTADITSTPSPVINSTLTASATYGVASTNYLITATNTPTSYNATGLPTGLTINTSTGEISGTPTDIAGSPFSVTISATNAGGTGTAILIYTINPKTLTLTSPTVPNKVYDRTNSATITGTLTGRLVTDVVTLNGTGTFAQITVGSGLAVISTSTLGGADALKYTLTQPTGLTGEIVIKPLIISAGATASNKTYDGNLTATLTGATLNGIISPDVVTLTGGATFASVDVANNISINTSSLTLGGADATNYIVLPIIGLTANITPKPLTISGLTASNKVYNGNTTATLSGTATLNGIVGTDDVSVFGTSIANFSDKNIGTAKSVTVSGYTLSGTKSGNYTVSQPSGLNANITPLALTVTSPVAQNKVFDGNTNATITGTLAGVISPDVVTFIGTGTFASSAAGTGIAVTSTSTLGGAGAGNYTLTQPTGLTANITSGATLTELILPQFIQGKDGTNTNRIPFAFRLTLSNLLSNATYRYFNGVVIPTDAINSNGAGNIIFSSAGTWVRSTGPGLSSAGNYGEFTTDASGNYTGWFITEPSGNATRFLPGTNVLMRINLNDGAGGTSVITRLTTTNTVKVINTVASAGANNGTGLRGNSGATPKNFVFVYDNEIGTGRPLSGSFVESDGTANTTTNSYSSFYGTNVDGVNGAYGLIIPNANTNGVRRIEQRDFAAGAIAGCVATDADGVWASGANTVNPIGGTMAIAISLTDAPLNTCVVTNIPPTILMDVATTSNYVDGGIATSPAGSFATSGVLNDPTDPAKNFGIDFTIGDTETAVGSLIVTAKSSNQAILPNAKLNLTGTGSSRNLKITPNAEGLATINVTVKDGTDSTTYIINYASSLASTNVSTTRFHTGTADASTAQTIDNNLMIVADDENQALRLYDRNNSGLPINSFDFTSSLGLTDISGGNPREVDIEASAKVGNRIYWMGSHSNASSGNNRPNRSRFFATDIAGTGNATTLSYLGRYDNLKSDLLAWDSSDGHGLGANFLGLTASSATGIAPEIADGSGFNIEGFEIAPNNTTAYICFRAPLQTTTTRTKALIIPVTNFANLVSGNPTSTTATFGAPIQLDLGGRAIREMKKNAAGEYLIIAGPNDGATGIAPKDFRFYTWTGNPTDAPILRSANLTALNSNGSFESIVDLPSPLLSNSNLQVLVDNGDAVFYGNGVIAKELPQNNHKKFRSELVNLGIEILPLITIKSITTGNWESTTTWDLGRIPQAGDLVIINQNHEVTLNATATVKKIEYQGTGKLNFNSASSVINTGL